MGMLPEEEKLLKMIHELEIGQANLKEEISRLIDQTDCSGSPRSNQIEPRLSYGYQRNSYSVSSYQRLERIKGGGEISKCKPTIPKRRSKPDPPLLSNFSNKQYMNILGSMGQAILIFELSGRITYWNRAAEKLYGYSATEAIGQNLVELLVNPSDSGDAYKVIELTTSGKNWSGQFPLKNKHGENFLVVATSAPFYDDNGSLVGTVSLTCDAQPFQSMLFPSSKSLPLESYPSATSLQTDPTTKPPSHSSQPLQVMTSKILDMASRITNKVRAKLRATDNTAECEDWSIDDHFYNEGVLKDVLLVHRDNAISSGASILRGNLATSPPNVTSETTIQEKSTGKLFGVSGDEDGGKFGIRNIINSKAEAWINKKGISWSWKGSRRDRPITRITNNVTPSLNHDQENDLADVSSTTSVSIESSSISTSRSNSSVALYDTGEEKHLQLRNPVGRLDNW